MLTQGGWLSRPSNIIFAAKALPPLKARLRASALGQKNALFRYEPSYHVGAGHPKTRHFSKNHGPSA
jgi:hypothetical protein